MSGRYWDRKDPRQWHDGERRYDDEGRDPGRQQPKKTTAAWQAYNRQKSVASELEREVKELRQETPMRDEAVRDENDDAKKRPGVMRTAAFVMNSYAR